MDEFSCFVGDQQKLCNQAVFGILFLKFFNEFNRVSLEGNFILANLCWLCSFGSKIMIMFDIAIVRM